MRNFWLLLMLALPASGQWTTNGFGFNFRSSLGYATDPPHTTVVRPGTVMGYPQSVVVDGITLVFGWEGASRTSTAGADRSTAVDARLAGVDYVNVLANFRVDLPAAGAYTIRLALGDVAGGALSQWATFADGPTQFAQPANNVAGTAGNFIDAAGNMWTTATWPSGNVAITHTFTTTTFYLHIGGGTGYSAVAHLFIQQGAGAAPTAVRHRVIQ